jgi:hypothetical protein
MQPYVAEMNTHKYVVPETNTQDLYADTSWNVATSFKVLLEFLVCCDLVLYSCAESCDCMICSSEFWTDVKLCY